MSAVISLEHPGPYAEVIRIVRSRIGVNDPCLQQFWVSDLGVEVGSVGPLRTIDRKKEDLPFGYRLAYVPTLSTTPDDTQKKIRTLNFRVPPENLDMVEDWTTLHRELAREVQHSDEQCGTEPAPVAFLFLPSMDGGKEKDGNEKKALRRWLSPLLPDGQVSGSESSTPQLYWHPEEAPKDRVFESYDACKSHLERELRPLEEILRSNFDQMRHEHFIPPFKSEDFFRFRFVQAKRHNQEPEDWYHLEAQLVTESLGSNHFWLTKLYLNCVERSLSHLKLACRDYVFNNEWLDVIGYTITPPPDSPNGEGRLRTGRPRIGYRKKENGAMHPVNTFELL